MMLSETNSSCSKMNRARLLDRLIDSALGVSSKTSVNDCNCGNNGEATPVGEQLCRPEAGCRDVMSWSTARMDASFTSIKLRRYGAGISDMHLSPAIRCRSSLGYVNWKSRCSTGSGWHTIKSSKRNSGGLCSYIEHLGRRQTESESQSL